MPDGTCPVKRRTGQKAKTQQAQSSLEQTQSRRGPGATAGEGRMQNHREMGRLALSPRLSFPGQQRAPGAASECFPSIPQTMAQGCVLGQDSGCTCGLGAASRVQEHSPGSASQSRMTSSQMWGWLGQAAGVGPWGQVEVGTRWPTVVLSAEAGVRRAHPDFLFYPMWLYGCQ